MKKIILLILSLLMVFGLCSCKSNPHRKLEFDDGTSYCFEGACGVYDEYISIGGGLTLTDYSRQYISINDRSYTITNCDCENINK
jgi:hypothetical protein